MSMFLKCMLMIWSFTKATTGLELFGVYTEWQSNCKTCIHTCGYILNVVLCNSTQAGGVSFVLMICNYITESGF
jgi:hypothetical protein